MQKLVVPIPVLSNNLGFSSTQVRWSSYPAYLNKAPCPNWLVKDAVFGELSFKHPVPAYQRFVDKGVDEETQTFYAKDQWPAMRGSKAFVEIANANALSHGQEIARHPLKDYVPMKTIVAAVAKRYGILVEDVLKAKRGRKAKNRPRWVSMKLCQDLSGERLSVIADYFHVEHYSTVSRTIRRLKDECEVNPELLIELNSISQDLTP